MRGRLFGTKVREGTHRRRLSSSVSPSHSERLPAPRGPNCCFSDLAIPLLRSEQILGPWVPKATARIASRSSGDERPQPRPSRPVLVLAARERIAMSLVIVQQSTGDKGLTADHPTPTCAGRVRENVSLRPPALWHSGYQDMRHSATPGKMLSRFEDSTPIHSAARAHVGVASPIILRTTSLRRDAHADAPLDCQVQSTGEGYVPVLVAPSPFYSPPRRACRAAKPAIQTATEEFHGPAFAIDLKDHLPTVSPQKIRAPDTRRLLITYQAHPVSQSARIVPSSLKIGSRRWHAIGFSFRRATA